MREFIERKEWLGSIPKEWGYIPGRFVFKPRNSKGNETEVLLAATQKQGMYPQHLLEGVVQVREGTDLQSFKTVHKNDYVISLRSFQGGFEMSDYEGVCSPAYQVFFNCKPIDHRYFKYLFKCQGFIQEMDSVTVGIREGKNIPYDSFARTYIPYPDIDEQSRIAAFLDERCAKIDEAIARHQGLIEKLDEYKKALVYKTIRFGINNNTILKETNISYIPTVPENWQIVHLGVLCSEVKHLNSELIETNALQFKLGNIISKSVGDSKYIPETLEAYTIVNPGDIVINGLNLNYDFISQRVAQVHEKGVITSAYIVVRPNKVSSDFIKYFLKGVDYIKTFHGMGKGIRLTLTYQELRRMGIALPSPLEQQKIVSFLEDKCADIDSAKVRHTQLIAKLEEYKKSLIYNAVTGKIEC